MGLFYMYKHIWMLQLSPDGGEKVADSCSNKRAKMVPPTLRKTLKTEVCEEAIATLEEWEQKRKSEG